MYVFSDMKKLLKDFQLIHVTANQNIVSNITSVNTNNSDNNQVHDGHQNNDNSGGDNNDDDDNDNGDDNHDGDDSGKRTTWPSSLLGVSASSHAGGFNSFFANNKPDWVYVSRPNKHDPNSNSLSTNLGVKRMS